ncbi:39S ribosomal protein L15, mitochondrial isoform X1 [Motacilla alba alba]|nr:39S ribosomal protein L15, mitochondrial isoform X1 [Motacilla alba alba]XP_038016303.1 39S ribosomal protein L15, mitochondrial isoform X1 [Motacilla alba alba]
MQPGGFRDSVWEHSAEVSVIKQPVLGSETPRAPCAQPLEPRAPAPPHTGPAAAARATPLRRRGGCGLRRCRKAARPGAIPAAPLGGSGHERERREPRPGAAALPAQGQPGQPEAQPRLQKAGTGLCSSCLNVSLIVLKERRRGRGRYGGRKCGRGHKGERQRGNRPRLGFEGGQTPFYLAIPKYGFNEGHSLRRQYQPLSLQRLQYLIDLGRVDPSQPIDLTQLTNARGVTVQPLKRDYGIQLVEEGADIFAAKVNIEVQRASELAIAAIEKNGGVVTTSFYDPRSLEILCKPVVFFLRGKPIPKRMLPPEDLVRYYTDPRNRGYLADPSKVAEARLELAKKYGYVLPDITKDELFKMLSARKDPRQIFFGLAPGWIVNLADKKILKPTDESLLKYYSS